MAQKPLPSAASGATEPTSPLAPTVPAGPPASAASAPTVPVGPPASGAGGYGASAPTVNLGGAGGSPPPPVILGGGAMPTQPLMPQGQIVLGGTTGQNPATTLPDPGANLRGWYPRWWLLSALFCSALMAVIALLLPTLCPDGTDALICQAASWTDWRQILVVGSVWCLFLIGWLVAHVFGVGTIEVDRQSRGTIAQAIHIISEFETLYRILYIYALVAFWVIVAMWYLNQFQVMSFTICSLVIFVGASCFMHRSKPRDRRSWLLGTVIFALFCILVMFWLSRMQTVILTAEILVVLVGLLCFFLTNPNAQAQNLTPVQIAALLRANQHSPTQVFLALLRPAFRRAAANQANINPPTGVP